MAVTNRRWYLGLGAACVAIAAVIAAVIVLAVSGTSQAAPTKSEYFARVTSYEVPVRYELESTRVKTTTVWRINPGGAAVRPSAR